MLLECIWHPEKLVPVITITITKSLANEIHFKKMIQLNTNKH